tara:strand:+ start:344 stop:1048 length:705 start_codon:yes stop_codon:yes gene_type:complete
MAVSVSTEIDAKTLGDLGHAIDRLQAETGRSTSDAVTLAALKVAESGRAASKIGKKNRTILVNPTWEEAKRSSASARRKVRASEKTGKPANLTHDEKVSLARYQKEPPFFIVRRRQNKGPALLPAWDRKDPRKEIKERGLAKKTWNVMVGKLGAMKGSSNAKTSIGTDFRVARYMETLGSEEKSVAVRLVNKLSYLEKAYPGITSEAITKGSNRLHKTLDDKIAKAVKKANSGR